MTLKELLELRAKKAAEAKAMIDAAETENRDFTPEEAASYQGIKAEIGTLNNRIARYEDQGEIDEELDKTIPAAASHGGSAIIRAAGPEAKREFENIAEFIHAATFNHNDPRLNYVERIGGDKQAEQSMGSGSEGGWAVPTQFIPTLRQVDPQQAIVRPRAEIIPAGSPPDSAVTLVALDQANGDSNAAKMYGGVEVVWTGEGKTVNETDANIREVTLTPHEVSGLVTLTNKLLRNWGASSAVIEKLLRGAVASAEDWAFISGNGVAKPMGFINAGAAYEVSRTTASTVKYTDVVNMSARLLGNSGLWLVSKSAIPKLKLMEDSEGHLIWQNSARDGEPPTLDGYPVMVNERSPVLGAKGDISLVDLSKYLIKDGSGPFVAASEHVEFKTNKTVIKIVWNVDGTPWLTAPLTGEGGYETSPFVVLDVPSA